MNNQYEEYISLFKNSFNNKYPHEGKMIDSFYFCDNKKSANELGQLVIEEIKKGTTSAYWGYDAAKEEMPKIGDLSIVTNFKEEPLCIIEVQEVKIMKFKDISKHDAEIEGEGDKSLKYWRRKHKAFFSRELNEYGLKFNRNMLVVFEIFNVIFK